MHEAWQFLALGILLAVLGWLTWPRKFNSRNWRHWLNAIFAGAAIVAAVVMWMNMIILWN